MRVRAGFAHFTCCTLLGCGHGHPLDSVRTAGQYPLSEAFGEAREAILPITNLDFSTYTTSIGAGSPTQNFTAVIDISWSDAWLPSTDCPKVSDPEYCAPHPLYNGSASTSHAGFDRVVAVTSGGFYATGTEAMDTYRIGAISVANQTFAEASDVRPTYFFDDDWYDTVLPLARTTVLEHMGSNLSAPSVFQNMRAQGRLSRNVMGLHLPSTEEQVGELRIGGISPAFEHGAEDPIRLPLVEEKQKPTANSTEYIRGGWNVDAVSVALESDPPIHYNLSGHIATFDTLIPQMILPTNFMNQVHDRLNSDDIEMPCARISGLPDMIVSLRGEGGRTHDFRLLGGDYVRAEPHVPYTDPGVCNWFAMGLHQIPDNVPPFIILGSLFLRKYYSVFDADEMAISCMYRVTF